MSSLTIVKRNVMGQETWRYTGQLLAQTENRITLQAYFDRNDMDFHGMLLAKGDRFLETWYTDRWYNIFEIHSRDDDHLRGWYCNIGQPAEFDGDNLSYIDLCLDLLVFPDGRQIVLDEDEFEAQDLAEATRHQALAALAELQEHFKSL